MRILVAGAGGFIGGHLVRRLLDEDHEVRAVDIKPLEQWYQFHPLAESLVLDLSTLEACREACYDVDQVYNLAAQMGGMGFIETHRAECALNVLISAHMLLAAKETAARFFYASSACVYAAGHQRDADVTALREEDAYPAEPEDGYGWEKLYTERMCRHFVEDYGFTTRVARYHNVYGPHGTYEGGREKAPAAICRKVIEAKLSGRHEIEIWGDGEQTRSFMYIDDCIEGTRRIMDGDYADPLNLGSSELVSINQLVSLVEDIAGIQLARTHNLSAPQGVRGRNSDNTQIRACLDWEPSTTLRDGMEKTYAWIYDQMVKR